MVVIELLRNISYLKLCEFIYNLNEMLGLFGKVLFKDFSKVLFKMVGFVVL